MGFSLQCRRNKVPLHQSAQTNRSSPEVEQRFLFNQSGGRGTKELRQEISRGTRVQKTVLRQKESSSIKKQRCKTKLHSLTSKHREVFTTSKPMHKGSFSTSKHRYKNYIPPISRDAKSLISHQWQIGSLSTNLQGAKYALPPISTSYRGSSSTNKERYSSTTWQKRRKDPANSE